MVERPHKPVTMPPWRLEASEDIDEAIWRSHPERKAALARDTAHLVVGRHLDKSLPPESAARIREFIEEGGLEDVAVLWADSPASSLAGALWRLYRVREGILAAPREVARLVSLGHASLDTIDPILVGLDDPVSPERVTGLIDQVFFGGLEGDLATALLRAGALAKVIAQGLLDIPAGDGNDSHGLATSSLAWGVVGAELIEAGAIESRSELT